MHLSWLQHSAVKNCNHDVMDLLQNLGDEEELPKFAPEKTESATPQNRSSLCDSGT